MSDLALRIKVSLKNDIRLFKGKFKDVKQVFDKLLAFINKSYELNNIKYVMQYKDDEGDLVTIANELDLDDAIEQSKQIKKTAKVFIKLKNVRQSNPVLINKVDVKPINDTESDNIKEAKEDINTDAIENEDDKDNKKRSKLTGVLCKDLCNNEEFKKEFMSFLSTIVLLYQSGQNNNDKMDLITCIVTALSQYDTLAQHNGIKKYTSKLDDVIPRLEIFASQVLLGFDVKNIKVIVNKFVEYKKNGNDCGNAFQSFGLTFPFMFMNNMFNCNNINDTTFKDCPGKHGLQTFYTSTGSYTCDECGISLPKASPMYGCRKCNFDLCIKCNNAAFCCFGNVNANQMNAPFMQNFAQRFEQGIDPDFGGGFGCDTHPGFHRRGHGRRWGHHGRRHGFKKRCGKWKKYCHDNNSNNNDKDDGMRVDVIENPMPKVSNMVDPNQGIIKTWKLKNVGLTNLPKGLIVKYSGRANNPMVNSSEFLIGNENEIKPDETLVVTICIKTPTEYGRFSSNWRLCTPDGKKFGQKLPFYLVLSPPNNNNNGSESKSDSNLRESEIDELIEKVVDLVDIEKKNQPNNNDVKPDPKVNTKVDPKAEPKPDAQVNRKPLVEPLPKVSMKPFPKALPKVNVKPFVKMEPLIAPKVDSKVEQKAEAVKDEPKVKPVNKDYDNGIDMQLNDSDNEDGADKFVNVFVTDNNPDEIEEKPHKYAEQLKSLKSMGFNNNDEYLVGLLDVNQGRLDQVINTLFN